jgi:uncharacterized protein
MSKSTVSKICLVITAHLVLVSYPTLATISTVRDLTIESDERLVTPYNSYITQSTNEQGKEVEDPIFEEVVSNRVDKLKQFLNSGGSPNRYLHAAINAGSIDSVKVMLDRGANVNLPGDEGVTPLMTAARVTYRGGIEMTELLIKRGANVNARASRGSTALMYASWGVAEHYQDEYVRVVRLLIKNGAKVNVKNKMGDTPLSIAKGGKWSKIVTELKKAGAKA